MKRSGEGRRQVASRANMYKPNPQDAAYSHVIGPCRLLLEARRKHTCEDVVGGIPPLVREEKVAAIREARDFLTQILKAVAAPDGRP